MQRVGCAQDRPLWRSMIDTGAITSEKTGSRRLRDSLLLVKRDFTLQLAPQPARHTQWPCPECGRVLQARIGLICHIRTHRTNHTCQPREKFSRDKRPAVERSEAGFGRGPRGSSPRYFQKPALQMVQSELFLSYICQYN